MQKYVFLAISVFVLGYCQGEKACKHEKCICPRIPDTKVFDAKKFAFIAQVTHINFTPHVPVPKYNSIVVNVKQLCKGDSPIEYTARLNTWKCGDENAFTHLQVDQYYFFYGIYKTLGGRISFIVDRCGPPCRPTPPDECPDSLDKCHNYY